MNDEPPRGVLPRSKLDPKMPQRVVSLTGIAPPVPQVNADVVERLEHLLAEARNGQIAGLVYGIVHPNADIATGWTGNASQHGMLVATTLLQHRAVTELVERE